MNEGEKQVFYEATQAAVSELVEKLTAVQEDRRQKVSELTQKIRVGHSPDRLVELKLLALYRAQVEELKHLRSAPYVSRCAILDEGGEAHELRFAKSAFPEEQIYSWIAPAAQLRFAACGDASYPRPDGTTAKVRLEQKDQLLIHDGKILFLATESTQAARELVYQAYFSQHKSQFALADIVAQMEAAQDQVIRAPVEGSMLITGPAGSGKTTLALHRVAYLAQAPETAERFPGKRIIVFVQDASSQQYFSHLLPELGIHDVAITTFDIWARTELGCTEIPFVDRFGESEHERDGYEWAKARALTETLTLKASQDPWELLHQWYEQTLEPTMFSVFVRQREERCLDRFDLTLLLQLRVAREGALLHDVTYYEERANGKLKKVQTREPLSYALLILDEVQNYLPAQIRLLRSCVDLRTRATLYVGDLAQQTRLATVRDWGAVGEHDLAAHTVRLEKVYRHTKEITSYLKDQGYKVTVRDDLRSGTAVEEKTISVIQGGAWLKEIQQKHPDVSIGCICSSNDLLDRAEVRSLASERVRILTIREAQGVEFDVVLFLDPAEPDFMGSDPAFIEEQRRVWRDLRYVGLTRAMNTLYVAKILPEGPSLESR